TTIDTWTGLIAGDACPDYAKEEMVMNVSDEWARKWFKTGDGRAWLEAHDFPRNPFFKPERECSTDDPRPILQFANLRENHVITETPLEIRAVINVTKGDFTGWRLEYGRGDDPAEWTLLAEGRNKYEQPDLIYTWNLQEVQENRITLRLYLMNGEDFYAEKRIFLTLSLPTPTPEPTLTPTLVPPTTAPTETLTPLPSFTPPPTDTPLPPPTETATPSAP
ncbi:MAG: hypothetical protein AB1509_10485, partial [Chloroflexota bacterium]